MGVPYMSCLVGVDDEEDDDDDDDLTALPGGVADLLPPATSSSFTGARATGGRGWGSVLTEAVAPLVVVVVVVVVVVLGLVSGFTHTCEKI